MPETEQPGRDPLEQHFASAVRALAGFGAGPGALGSLSPERGLELFDAQLASRMLDVAARVVARLTFPMRNKIENRFWAVSSAKKAFAVGLASRAAWRSSGI